MHAQARAIGAGGFAIPEQRRTQLNQVKRRSVPCPDCRAEVDAVCVTANGKALPACHRARVRIATRKLMEDRRKEAELRTL